MIQTHSKYFVQVGYENHWSVFFNINKNIINTEIDSIIDVEILNMTIFHVVNQQREKYNCPALKYNPILKNSSEVHCHNMITCNCFDHNLTDRTMKKFKNPYKRIQFYGKDRFMSMGENIADFALYKSFTVYGFIKKYVYHSYLSLSEKVVLAWMDSSGHRKNILRDFDYQAIASILYEKNSIPRVKITQNFGG